MDDNANKSQHGAKAQQSLESILKNLKDNGYIVSIEKSYKSNSSQSNTGYPIYAAFRVKLTNGEYWALYSTTSMRTDRVKAQHWDSFLIKRFNKADKCYLVYPDTIETDGDFKGQHIKLQEIQKTPDALDELDGIITTSEMRHKIERLIASYQPHGVREAVSGINFEKNVCDVLNQASNLIKWNNQETLEVGYQYSLFADIMTKFGCPHDVYSVCATTDIPPLPSRGKPKTDVAVTVKFNSGEIEVYTISCKKSSGKAVSVHQYSAEAFIESLQIKEASLRENIRTFQEKGSLSELGHEKELQMTAELKPYVERLCWWVITGKYGAMNNEKLQCADFLLAFDNDNGKYRIYSAEEYIAKLLKVEKHFGTPFQWTYASGCKGKNIQLKMPTFKIEYQIK